MKTEYKLVFILFVMAFSTVFLLYAVVSNDSGQFSGGAPVIPTADDIGKTVYVEGTVLSKRSTYQGEHLIVNIECSDRTILMVFVSKSVGAASVSQKINVNDFVGIQGTVQEYNGTLEIVLKNESQFLKLK
ncbi:hypothetical protein MmiAt1_02070 [Methanimicrococcus sp. At1]|uniref:Uncharacterized protein n=1 Tax=Methanimicrococcus hacksteinii TaxID=3028293 RepID=A0ABU3VMN7_9EURY|nr:hypothetical protein [Methanimicrococcus sp. At1]MDV0444674.1 hypothetical protein [Methanimicrococcus sp. At1]